MMTMTGLIVGTIGGLVVTALVVMVWPKNRLRSLRPLVAPVVGLGVAYLLMRLI